MHEKHTATLASPNRKEHGLTGCTRQSPLYVLPPLTHTLCMPGNCNLQLLLSSLHQGVSNVLLYSQRAQQQTFARLDMPGWPAAAHMHIHKTCTQTDNRAPYAHSAHRPKYTPQRHPRVTKSSPINLTAYIPPPAPQVGSCPITSLAPYHSLPASLAQHTAASSCRPP